MHEASQRFALPALGLGRRSRPARKMLRRVKLLGMCAESPASGARFVRRVLLCKTRLLEKRHAAIRISILALEFFYLKMKRDNQLLLVNAPFLSLHAFQFAPHFLLIFYAIHQFEAKLLLRPQ